MKRRRLVWASVLVAWALLLVVLAVVTQGDPTVAQQQTAAAARPDVDRVLASAVGLVGDDVVAVGPYQRVGGCALSAARRGVAYTRTADVYGRSGDTPRLLDRFLTGLPKADNPRRLIGVEGTVVGADPPNTFVKLVVRAVGSDSDGHVLVSVDTGCRPVSSRPHAEFLAPPDLRERARPQSVAQALGVAPARWRRTVLSCPGGSYTTITARAPDSAGTPLEQRPDRDAADPNGGTVLNDSPTRLVERLPDGTGVVVELSDDQLRVESTTPCR